MTGVRNGERVRYLKHKEGNMTHILQVTAGEKIGPLHRVNIRADGKAYYWQAGGDPEPMYFAIYAPPEGHRLFVDVHEKATVVGYWGWNGNGGEHDQG